MNNKQITTLLRTAFVLGWSYKDKTLTEALKKFDQTQEDEKENNDLLEQGLHNDFTP